MLYSPWKEPQNKDVSVKRCDERPVNASKTPYARTFDSRLIIAPRSMPTSPYKSGTWLPTSLPAPFLAGPVALRGPGDEHSTAFQDQRCKPSAGLPVDGLGSRGWRFYPHGMSCLSAWMQQPQSLELEDVRGVHLGDFLVEWKTRLCRPLYFKHTHFSLAVHGKAMQYLQLPFQLTAWHVQTLFLAFRSEWQRKENHKRHQDINTDGLTECRAHPPPSLWSWLQRKNRETKMSQWFQLLHTIHHSSRSSLHMSVCDHDSRHWPLHWEEMYVETSTRSNHRVGNCNLSLRRASWVLWWTGAGESCTLLMKLKVDLLLMSPTWRSKEKELFLYLLSLSVFKI